MAYLSPDVLLSMGFAKLGLDVKVSDKASIHNAGCIEIGDHSRIDDFCVLSAGEGGICLGRNVHVAAACTLVGAGRIELQDFAGLAARVSIFSSSDDYSGASMTNPTVPSQFTNVTHANVIVQRHVIVGAGSVILPGVTLHEGCGVGALALIRNDCQAFGLYFGAPARRIGVRRHDMIDIERDWLANGAEL